MQDPIQLLISIDVEPDERFLMLNGSASWRGLEYLFAHVGEMREKLSQSTGRSAHLGWYWRLDPQIEKAFGNAAWPLRTYECEIAVLARAGDEFGVHPHAWRWDDKRRTWYVDLADQSWIEYCVRSSLDAFEKFFGRPCKSFRFGDGWINDKTLDLIERLGVNFDLTLEPGRLAVKHGQPWELVTADNPDTRGAPIMPYWRSRNEFRCVDRNHDSGLWIVPVSTATLAYDRDGITAVEHGAVEMDRRMHALESLKRIAGRVTNLMRMGPLIARSSWARAIANRLGQAYLDLFTGDSWTKTQALNMVFDHATYACGFDHALATSNDRYVHTVLRSGDLANRRERTNFTKNLDFIIGHRHAHRFKVSTPGRFLTR